VTNDPATMRDPAGRAASAGWMALGPVAALMWILANLLPGFDGGSGHVQTYVGAQLTLLGWDLAMLADDYVALVGWTTNLWLVGAVGVLLWHGRREPSDPEDLVATRFLTLMTVVCACLAAVALSRSEYVVRIEVGTWLWVASIGVFAVFTVAWASDRSRRGAIAHALDPGVNAAAAGTTSDPAGARSAPTGSDHSPASDRDHGTAVYEPSRWVWPP
jgi:hypothetical protein